MYVEEDTEAEFFGRLKSACRDQLPAIYQGLLEYFQVSDFGKIDEARISRLAGEHPILGFGLIAGSQEGEVSRRIAPYITVASGAENRSLFSNIRISARGRQEIRAILVERWEGIAAVAHACWVLHHRFLPGAKDTSAGPMPLPGIVRHLLDHAHCDEVDALKKSHWFGWFDKWPELGSLLVCSCLPQRRMAEASSDAAGAPYDAALSRVVSGRHWRRLKAALGRIGSSPTRGLSSSPIQATPRPRLV
jgi:hypothetical protein